MDQQTQESSLILTQQPHTSILDGVIFNEDTQQWVDWVEAYHAWLQSKKRLSGGENTAKTYDIAWRQFFRFAQTAPWDVTPKLAQRWTLALSQQNLAESTTNLKIAALSSFYNFVQKSYDLWPADRRNPFSAVERHKVSPYGRAKYPSVDESKAILNAINTDCTTGKRDLALLYTILVSCRRSSEILNLKWGDLQETPQGDYAFSYIYKGGKQKKAILNRRCYQAITTYLKATNRLDTISDDDYIFVPLDLSRATRLPCVSHSNPNQPLSNSLCNRILKKYARRAGVDLAKAHIHGLRHAGARLRVQQMRQGQGGVDLEEIMNLLGHSSLAITQIYTAAILDDPIDKGGQAAADELLPKGPRRRKTKKPSPSQLPLEAALSPDKLRIAELEAELAQYRKEGKR